MKKMGKILKWIPPAFFALLILAGGASAIFFLLATILTLPIPKLQQFKKEKLKIGTGLTVLLSVILLVVGIMISPTNPKDNDDEPSRSSISETDSSSTESSVTSSTEEKETTTTTTSTEEEKTKTTTTPAITTTVETTTTTVTTPEPTIPEDSSFSITYLDVGQADAALVECDGHYMLIDGGNKGDSSLMYTVLKNAGVTHLDIVVGTHAHEDHIGGLPGAFNYATADMTLCPVTSGDSDAFNDFKKYADSKGGGITVPSVGDQYELGSADIEILGVNAESDANNTWSMYLLDKTDMSIETGLIPYKLQVDTFAMSVSLDDLDIDESGFYTASSKNAFIDFCKARKQAYDEWSDEQKRIAEQRCLCLENEQKRIERQRLEKERVAEEMRIKRQQAEEAKRKAAEVAKQQRAMNEQEEILQLHQRTGGYIGTKIKGSYQVYTLSQIVSDRPTQNWLKPYSMQEFETCIREMQEYKYVGVRKLFAKMCFIESEEISILLNLYHNLKESNSKIVGDLEFLMCAAGIALE